MISAPAESVAHHETTFDVSGSADESSSYLYVYAKRDGAACAGSPGQQAQQSSLIFQARAVQGSFGEAYRFTPSTSGVWLLCAYVANGSASTVYASAAASVAVRDPRASLSITGPVDARVERDAPFQVAGTSEVDANLVVQLRRAEGCPPSPASEGAEIIYFGREVGKTFDEGYSWEPGHPGRVAICAYVVARQGGSVYGTAGSVMDVRSPRADMAVRFEGPVVQDELSTIVVSGMTEHPGNLVVLRKLDDGKPCAPDAATQSLSSPDGQARPVEGGFEERFGWAFEYTARWIVCSYVVERAEAFDFTNSGTWGGAAGTVDVSPPAPPQLGRFRVNAQHVQGTTRRRPGFSALHVTFTPFAATIELRVLRRGRVLKRATLARARNPGLRLPGDPLPAHDNFETPEDAGVRSHEYRWRCDAGGLTTFEVTATDHSGRKSTRRVSRRLPSCARVIADYRRERAQQIAAEEAAQRALRRAKRRCRRRDGGRPIRRHGQWLCYQGIVIVGIIGYPIR